MPAKLHAAYFGQTHIQEVVVLVTLFVTVATLVTVVDDATPISTGVTVVIPVITVVSPTIGKPLLVPITVS